MTGRAERRRGLINMAEPPVPKYKLTLVITGNTHEEVEEELYQYANSCFLLDTHGYRRDEFEVLGGTRHAKLEHLNPSQTPEGYMSDLSAWFRNRKFSEVDVWQ